jgi:hypothetical protein
MLNITDILNLNLTDEFKSVIDLESRKDDVIQSEIESYIVTEGIARHLSSFLNDYKSNMQETGVWLSGFYGSGKSHFAKMLGYILANPKINGTSAIDRFIPRLKGVSGEELLKNSINGLAPYNSRVIFLDIAKQDTSNGLAFTLFANFLKNLGFKDDIHGYMEFELFINGKYDDFKNAVLKLENQEWNEFKKINQNAISGMRKASLEIGFTENDYQNILNNYGTAIKNFSAGKFKEELSKYLKFEKEERLVFIFDEASEAISTDKFSLLELQGVSEALSGLGSRAWSIAIAQEKLDDVINKPNVNRSQLTKVTDRFKTKIHLESTEVDLIIRNRLLQKTNSGKDKLLDYFKEKKALVADATNLQSLIKETQTTNADDFAEYYPFHRYQFDLMQKFLFSSKALASSQIAERGMIITTVDVLKKQINKMKLFDFTPGYSICAEAQPAPPAELVNKYDSAQKA